MPEQQEFSFSNELKKATALTTIPFVPGTAALANIHKAYGEFDSEEAWSDLSKGFELGQDRRTLIDNFYAERTNVSKKLQEVRDHVEEETGISIKTNRTFQQDKFFEQLGEAKKLRPDLDIPNKEDIYNELGIEAKQFQANEAEFNSDTGYFGTIGQFSGGITGSFLDPVDALINVIPIGRGATVAKRIASEMGFSGGAEFFTNLLGAQSYRKKLGLDYGVDKALESAATVAIGAGAFRGVGEAGGAVARSAKEVSTRPKKVDMVRTIEQDEKLAKIAREEIGDNATDAQAAVLNEIESNISFRKNNPLSKDVFGENEYVAKVERMRQAFEKGEALPSFPQLTDQQIQVKHRSATILRKTDKEAFNGLLELDNQISGMKQGEGPSRLNGPQRVSNIIDDFAAIDGHPVSNALKDAQVAIDKGENIVKVSQNFSNTIKGLQKGGDLTPEALKAKPQVFDGIEDTIDFADTPIEPRTYSDRFDKDLEISVDTGKQGIDVGTGRIIDVDEVVSVSGSNERTMGDVASSIKSKKQISKQLAQKEGNIDDIISANSLDDANAQQVKTVSNDIRKELADNDLSGVDLDTELRKRLKEEVDFQAETEAIRATRSIEVKDGLNKKVDDWVVANPDKYVGKQMHYMFDDIEARIHTVRASAMRRFDKNLEKYRTKWAGTYRTVEDQDNIIRNLYGENAGDEAANALSTEYPDVLNFLIDRANKAGAGIRNKKDFALPRFHSAENVRKAGPDQFTKDYMEWIDWDKTVRPRSGTKVPAEEREKVLKEIWSTLQSGGKNKVGKKDQGTTNFMGDDRFIVYKNADAHINAMKKYSGGKSAHDIMLNYISRMSKFSAGMEKMGPNPFATKKLMKERMFKNAADLDLRSKGKTNFSRKADQDSDKIEALFDNTVLFDFGRPGRLLKSVQNVKALSYSALLGNTPIISVPTDLYTSSMASKIGKVPSLRFLRFYNDAVRSHIGNDKEHRRFMGRMGVINEIVANSNYEHTRFAGDLMHASKNVARMADVSNRLSGLAQVTQGAKDAIGMETASQLADFRFTALDKLPKALKTRFDNSGITKKDWDVLRKGHTETHKGHEFISPEMIRDNEAIDEVVRNEIADKFMDMYYNTQFLGVIEKRARSVAALKGNRSHAGMNDVINEVKSTFLHYPVTMIQQMDKQLDMKVGTRDKIGYAASRTLGLTSAAMVGGIATDIANGRDPDEMFSIENVEKSALSFVPLMDSFLYSAGTYGKGIGDIAFGPVGKFVDQLNDITVGTVKDYARGEGIKFTKEGDVDPASVEKQDEKFRQNAFNIVKQWAPNLNNPFTKGLYERYVWDRTEEWFVGDSVFDKRRKKLEGQYRERNATMFSPPRLSTDEPSVNVTTPDVSKVFRGEEFGVPFRREREARKGEVIDKRALRKPLEDISELLKADPRDLSKNERTTFNRKIDKINKIIQEQPELLAKGFETLSDEETFKLIEDIKSGKVKKIPSKKKKKK